MSGPRGGNGGREETGGSDESSEDSEDGKTDCTITGATVADAFLCTKNCACCLP
jgi:hypothetical protein